MIKNSSYCFADVFCPESVQILGDRNSTDDFKEHVPELYPIAYKLLWIYINGAFTLESTSLKRATKHYVTEETMCKRRRYSKCLNINVLIRMLLGRIEFIGNQREFTFGCDNRHVNKREHNPNQTIPNNPNVSRTNYFVQLFPYINPETGEIHDEIALSYRENAKAAGYVAYLYRCSDNELGCIVSVIERLKHKDLCKISAKLATKFPEVNPRYNSLYTDVRPLLSPIFQSGYCYPYKTDDSIETILNQLLIVAPEGNDQIDFEESEHYKEQKSHPNYPVGFVVDSEVRNQIITHYKTTDPGLLNIVGHHIYGSWKDGDYSIVNIPQMELLIKENHGKRRFISKWLDRLGEITAVEVIPYSINEKATRYKIQVPECLSHVKQHKIIDNPVLLSDGKIREYAGKMYEAKRNYSRECPTKYPNPVSLPLVDYLNNLPTNTFTSRINTNWQDIKAAVEVLDEEAKNDAISSINHIKVCPQPIYKQAENSSRIYAIGSSFQTIKKLIRNLVFSDCEKADLLHAQLSIASYVFGAKELIPLLKSGETWAILCRESGLDKGTFKSILYACLFSNSFDVDEYKSLKNHTREDVAKFFSALSMNYFFTRRKEFLANNFNGITEDVFGNKLQGTDSQKLSALMHSYELMLLQPAIEYLTSLKDRKVKIVLWLHDGFYFTCPTKDKTGIKKKLIKLTNDMCDSLNICSKLIIE